MSKPIDVFSPEQMVEIRSRFDYVDLDKNGCRRLYFDNAGGAFRLKDASKAFSSINAIPDCSERMHEMAIYLQDIENRGKKDARIIFNAADGSIYPTYTASMAMFEIIRIISANATGTNMVTTVLEHPSSFDAMTMYAQEHHCELRVAQSDPETGGVPIKNIINLVDENTRILSVMAASNISGYIFDIDEIVRQARAIQPNIFIVVDGVQHAPHGVLDVAKSKIDAINIAPYKFFGIRGLGLAYLSDRVASMAHHELLRNDKSNWELGSPAPGHWAALSAIVDYVCWLGQELGKIIISDRREAFIRGMKKIHAHEEVLLKTMLEGTEEIEGLREMEGVNVYCDGADLSHRDLILGLGFEHLDPASAVREYEKRQVITYERVKSSQYSKRMVESFGLDGLVRISPLHCNTVEDIEEFLSITKDLAQG